MSELISRIKRSDETIYYLFNHKMNGRVLSNIMKVITHMADTVPVIIFCVFALALQNLHFVENFGTIAVISILISQGLVQLIKRFVNRPRPYKVLNTKFTIPPPKCAYSFPSGHTNAAFCMASSLSIAIPILSPVLILAASAIGFSRIYLGVHYPTDVLIGAMLAFISTSIAMLLI